MGKRLHAPNADYSFLPAGFHWIFNNAVDTVADEDNIVEMEIEDEPVKVEETPLPTGYLL